MIKVARTKIRVGQYYTVKSVSKSPQAGQRVIFVGT